MYKIILGSLVALGGVFVFWYFNTVTLTGRIVDTKGNILSDVIYSKVYAGGVYRLGQVDATGRFTIANVSRGELCILFSFDVAKGENTYQLNLLEKCAEVEPFEDRNVGDIVINIDEAIRLTLFDDLKNSKELAIYTKYREKKKIILEKGE